ncbi:MAG TPA: CpsB/CapC family capsule biosynthesis tyrosine phosphatase [Polyangiaceae bacterium]|nr:CpsB/CapC family capsule biosynthesis tyrosine phosphatase [Polyangiaceae bacterium]
MTGFVDLHCHWIPGVDDGVESLDDAVGLLRSLAGLGFARVVATPHMRPGMFDNTASDLRAAFERTEAALAPIGELPERALSSEHFFDDIVFRRLLAGDGLPYPGGAAVLLEFYDNGFPPRVEQLFAQLRERGLTPVIAHPERYRVIWDRPTLLDRLLDSGAVALLDVAALVGKYGRQPQRCAERLLEGGAYHAACSDAHRVRDVAEVARGIDVVRRRYGDAEVDALFRAGPLEILAGDALR